MPFRRGELVSHYRLLDVIGQGGMGVVWKALDTRLGREIALKTLPVTLADDPVRIARFDHEARMLAALKHPNIVTIYSVEEVEDTRFLTMELVKGESLAKLIPKRGMPLEKIFGTGIPLAAALAAAHDKGVIHRDLKPANVMVDEDGILKVLDFGLAKLKAIASEDAATDVPTETMTATGQAVGTLPYMSPEQIQAKPVDLRCDVFALGVTLHEMATGSRPFQGSTAPDLASSILRDTPAPVTELRPDLPEHLGRIIRRCLEKEPTRRYQSALDVRNELEDLRKETESAGGKEDHSVAGVRRRRTWKVAAAVIAAALILVMIGLLSYGPTRRLFTRQGTEIRSLAVLPFTNLMGDAAQDYFVEGMHDALITELAKTGLKVISRTSVMRYGQKSGMPLPQIAQELGVDALLEGSVLRVGSNVRVNAQLIRGTTDENVWAETYDRDLANAMSMLSEVTRAIAAQVKITLSPQQEERLARKRPVNPQAQEAYFLGKYFMNRFSTRTLMQARGMFQKAIGIDPSYAEPYAGLAMTYALSSIFASGARGPDILQQYRASARKAVELDPQLAEGHAVLGLASLYLDWDWPQAEKELKRAIELNPAEAFVYHPYADCFLVQGQVEDSLDWVKKGAELDPKSPLIVGPVMGHLRFNRRWDETLSAGRRFRTEFPDSAFGGLIIRDALWHKGLYDEALSEFRSQWKDDGDLLRALEQGFRNNGPHGAMRAVADTLAARSKAGQQNPFEIAGYYAEANAADPSIQWLERAYLERVPFLAHVRADPAFDLIRSDPRFVSLLRRMNFPK